MTTHDIDAVGLLCPLPVLKLRKALLAANAGDVVRLHSSDKAALIDVPHFCAQSGHELLDAQQEEGVTIFEVRAAHSDAGDA